MNASSWSPARDALDRAAADGRTIRIWLRDDDCVAVTPALARLEAIAAAVSLPLLLAVIPEPAEDTLPAWIEDHPGTIPCQHGWAHRNHAAPGERAREIGGARPLREVLDELARGRAKLQSLFGPHLSDILVPPWNRIDAAVLPHLPVLGYAALSTFGPTPAPDGGIHRIDSDLDIIDWRNGRVGRSPEDLSRKLAALISQQDTIGVLTHHLAHDATAWAALDEMLAWLHEHPAVRFTDAGTVLLEPSYPPTLLPRP